VTAHSVIVWDTPSAVAEDGGSSGTFTYSDLSGAAVRPGAGNINASPRFLNAAADDFRLSFSSPCRATGKDGSDMGAFPYVPTGETNEFLRCDTNSDGLNDLSDAIFTLFALFAGGGSPACNASADCNVDGRLDVSDVIFDLSYLFTGGPKPPGPFPACETAHIEDCFDQTCVNP
jgi:hypothetical protein